MLTKSCFFLTFFSFWFCFLVDLYLFKPWKKTLQIKQYEKENCSQLMSTLTPEPLMRGHRFILREKMGNSHTEEQAVNSCTLLKDKIEWMWTEYLVILFKITDISPFLSWRPVSTHTVGYFPETDTVLRQLTVISYLCFLQLLRQQDEILSCLFSSTWQGTGVTSGRIEWPSCKKVSCQQVRHHDTRTHAPAVDSVTVKSYTLLPFTNWQLHARPTDSFRGEAENLTKFL